MIVASSRTVNYFITIFVFVCCFVAVATARDRSKAVSELAATATMAAKNNLKLN